MSATCVHCLGDALGHATIPKGRICHPDRGMDCYRLVTIYDHTVPCKSCYQVRLVSHD